MREEKKKHRAFNFDLKIKLLKKYYPKKNILGAYRDIKSFMFKNGFSHRQWSGYRTDEKLTDRQVQIIMLQMRKELPWIDKCSTKLDVTNIGKVYDIKNFFKSWDIEAGDRDIENLFQDSEIKMDVVKDKREALDEKIKSAKKQVKEKERDIDIQTRNVKNNYEI